MSYSDSDRIAISFHWCIICKYFLRFLGTKAERGLLSLQYNDHGGSDIGTGSDSRNGHTTYDLPYVSDWLRRQRIFSYMPFLPSYTDRTCLPKFRNRPMKKGEIGRASI